MAQEADATSEVENGSVTKYWWFLMIIPVGLIIGTVTSTCNHLKQDKEKDEMAQYLVSEDFNKKSLEDDMRKAFTAPNQEASIALKAISSANGLNHYLKTKPTRIDGLGALGYYDVKALDSDKRSEILAIVMELDEQDAGSRAAMIGMNIAVMKSVFGEKEFTHTLRFVFLPSRKTDILGNQDLLTLPGEKLIDYYVMRPTAQPNFEREEWVKQGNIISHPALDRRAEKILTEKQITLAFQAAKQLRTFLLEKL